MLLGQQDLQVAEFDLDQIAMPPLIQPFQQGAIEEAAIGAQHQALMGRKLGAQLLHEGDDAVAGVGAAGAQPGLDDLLGRSAEGQQRVIGQGAALMGIVALGHPFLATINGLDRGIHIDPLLRHDADARAPGACGPCPHPLAQDMVEGLQLTDVAVADRLEQPPEGGLIRHPWPVRQTLQHLIAPQGDALAEAARPADQADHHQHGGIAQAINGIRAPLMVHLLTKQRPEAEVAEELDHRGQTGLAGERRTRHIEVDLGGFEPCRPAGFCAMFAH